ncbi:carboxymuconolactone decarboxylase family protein [Pseudobacteriovorax antillogorgiicola]|uniref:Alkylhydroperoxidase AhpD family core domain-containing protein n=1 Tax=Pseudobacteriovorax antillogorgiicola TaxID=1513793 RepID=A0A1Y6B3L1_9BACT|nr:carboxymuconolactone decarboxylase family protein [Pseudobacteriovorax antillogorgiicola]TCS59538.1 AhpD family alkylhydroperoxidase [Pseudobacteriovorax antillogorgiicola]SME87798.1 alkylhydroperoxidase AhpD family core domain-containing protein [Pseudobacteriovorax antillogorgiicola]
MQKSSREPVFLYTDEQVREKSPIARSFLEQREVQNKAVDEANNKLLKRIYNVDHNAYLEGGALAARTKELMGLVASAALRCDDCINYHIIQSYRLGASRAEQEESINIATVVGGTIVVPHLRRAYMLLGELYA